MTFWRRLRLYGFGFGIGLAIVYSMFGTRSCTTPNELKMQELVFQYFKIEEKAQCKMKCLGMPEQLLKIYLRHFEINYDLSEVRAKPCGKYYVEAKKEFASKYKFKLIMLDCDTITKIEDIQLLTTLENCPCQ